MYRNPLWKASPAGPCSPATAVRELSAMLSPFESHTRTTLFAPGTLTYTAPSGPIAITRAPGTFAKYLICSPDATVSGLGNGPFGGVTVPPSLFEPPQPSDAEAMPTTPAMATSGLMTYVPW